jgi:glycosyltransferase involved in cell wall biosynthesis
MNKIESKAITASIIIATKDRPHDLRECLRSIVNQTELPMEVIIVDSSKDDESYKIILEFRKYLSIKYVKVEHPSLTYQRNIGVKMASGNVIHFLDDDVILNHDYLEKIHEIYRNDLTGAIKGVGGLIIQPIRKGGYNFLNDLFRKIFMLTNDKGDGRLLRSGWASVQYRKNVTNVARTEILQGCCSYRKVVFDEYEFDERLSGLALREDIDFSYRVSRKYELIYTPFAKLYHKKSPAGREDEEVYYQKYFYNHYYLFKKNIKPSVINYLCFIWSDIGSLLAIVFLCLKERNVKPLKGVVRGYLCIFQDFFHCEFKI